jgi:uncharacterized membrane protein (UPF0127 family)
MHKPGLLIIGVVLFLAGCNPAYVRKVCIRHACVAVEIADTPEKQERGLMFRKDLADNQGMLFVFPKPDRYGFWMKNMEIPLDFIWIDQDRKIVSLNTGVMPCAAKPCPVISPKYPAQYVLEVNSGFIASHSICLDDRVNFR